VKGCKANTVGKNVKQLIMFLKNRRAKNIIPELNLTGFKIMEEEADAIYLTPDEIALIREIDLSAAAHLEKRDGLLYKKQTKTKHWVAIPLRDEAHYILTVSFKSNIPQISNPDFNYYIKEVGKRAGLIQAVKHSYMKGNKEIIETKPKFEWISSHTCRRSFCTNEYLAGTPVELVMKISGHKSLKDFYKYIKIAPSKQDSG
jgi:hypothetical protein